MIYGTEQYTAVVSSGESTPFIWISVFRTRLSTLRLIINKLGPFPNCFEQARQVSIDSVLDSFKMGANLSCLIKTTFSLNFLTTFILNRQRFHLYPGFLNLT